MHRFLLTLLVLLSTPALAYEKLDVVLPTGTDLRMTRFAGDGETLLIWIPSEYGFANGYIPVASDLQARGLGVWVLHLHQTYMMAAGRSSLDEVELDDLMAVLDSAHEQGFKSVFLVSANRGAQIALELSYRWQQRHPSSAWLRGHLWFSPHLIDGRPEPGQQAKYIELANYSNLPIYLLQAQFSTKYAHTRSIVEQLQRGGSPVFVHLVDGAQGGFQTRPDSHLTEHDLAMRASLGAIMEQATRMLTQVQAAPLVAGYTGSDAKSRIDVELTTAPGLKPFSGVKDPPPLRLPNLDRQVRDLQQLQGKVVLVNFWASWCGPCVREIPSMSRLVDALQGEAFEVLAVNVGEPVEVIEEFLQQIPVNFDVLVDTSSSTVRSWRVYAYPSNFLIDRQGRIRYAYRGALQWDDPEVIEVIKDLLDQ